MRPSPKLIALLLALCGCATNPPAPPAATPSSEPQTSNAPDAPAAPEGPALPGVPSPPGASTGAAPAALSGGSTVVTPPGPGPARPIPLEADLEPKLAAILRSHQLQGVIARLDGGAPSARCSDVARCKTALTPASTFKIANSIIGLETGVIADAEYLIRWDGVDRSLPAWNQDHTLRTAIRDSAVWYYQELARRVGQARMQAWLQRLDYGNMQMGEVIDRFWLDGPLAITALEQLEFLRRLMLAQLPISERTRDIVLDITRLGEIDGKPLHGKTGWARPGQPTEIGWFVGFVEDPAGPRYVAVALDPVRKGVDMAMIRRAVGEEALRVRLE